MPKLYKVTEVATILGVKPPTVYNWVNQEKLPHLRLGRLIRFIPQQIDDLLRRSSRGPGQPIPDGGKDRSDRGNDKIRLPLDKGEDGNGHENAEPHLDGGVDPNGEES